jgi:tryptophanyl-tRNA synthetase
MGGIPEDCVVYEMLLYHLLQSDAELKEVYQQCKNGSIMCGECKARAAELMKDFFKDLEKKREKARDKAESILN